MSSQPTGGERSISATDIGGIASSGDNAIIVAPQVHAQVANFGISYSDAREIALEVFRNNFELLANDAYDLARQRAERVTDEFLVKLSQRYPEAIKNFRQPGLQRALLKVQEEAACSEDGDIDDALVDILVERANEESRSLRRIVLDEALATAAKLTRQQLSTLSLAFYLLHVQQLGIPYNGGLDVLRHMVGTSLSPLRELAHSTNDLRYLQYAGCLSLSMGQTSAEVVFANKYPGLLCQEINIHAVSDNLRPAFQDVPEDPTRLRIPVVDHESLVDHLTKLGLAEHVEKVKNLLVASPKPYLEIRDLLSAGNEQIRHLLTTWDDSEMKYIELTSVGLAIGHANLRRVAGFPAGLQIWIPD